MTRTTLSNLLAIFGLIIALAVSFSSTLLYAKTLTVNVSGLRSTTGVVHVLVYDNARAFNAGSVTHLVGYGVADASLDEISVLVDGIRPGRYALTVHHDENSNDGFDQINEIPLEGWGYSNNVGEQDIPDFAAASFEMGSGGTSLDITIFYAD